MPNQFFNNPTQHPEDFLAAGPEPSGLDAYDKLHMGGMARKLRGEWWQELPVIGEIPEDQKPFLAEQVSLTTGEHFLGPLSLMESLELAGGEHYLGGFTSKNAKNQQITAAYIMAGREILEGTEADWAALSAEDRGRLGDFIGEWAGINALKSPHRHLEPIFTNVWDTPHDLFLADPHPDYTSDKLYELMWKIKPEFMGRLEQLGASTAYFAEARNSHEWFYKANTLIQDNYKRMSMMWSGETSGNWKHITGNLSNFVVAGILNDPDMAAELAIVLGLTLTTGVGGGAYTAWRIGSKVKKGMDIAHDLKILGNINKMYNIAKWLPSNIPHTLLTRGGGKTKHWINPTGKLFWANAIEGGFTGSVAEIRNQMARVQYLNQDGISWMSVAHEGALEAMLTPGINPAFGAITRAGGWAAGHTAVGIGKAGQAMFGQTGFQLNEDLAERIRLGVRGFHSRGTTEDTVALQLGGEIAIGQLRTMLSSFGEEGDPVTVEEVNEAMMAWFGWNVESAADAGVDQVQELITFISATLQFAEAMGEGLRPSLGDLVMQLAIAGPQSRGEIATEEEFVEAQQIAFQAWVRAKSATTARARNKRGERTSKGEKWTQADVLKEVLPAKDGSTGGDLMVILTEDEKKLVKEELNLKPGFDGRAATEKQVWAAWAKVHKRINKAKAKAFSRARRKVARATKDATKDLRLAEEAAEVVSHSVIISHDGEIAFSPEVARRIDQVEELTTQIQFLVQELVDYSNRTTPPLVSNVEQLIQIVDTTPTRGSKTKLKAAAKALGLKQSGTVANLKSRISEHLKEMTEEAPPAVVGIINELPGRAEIEVEAEAPRDPNFEKDLAVRISEAIRRLRNIADSFDETSVKMGAIDEGFINHLIEVAEGQLSRINTEIELASADTTFATEEVGTETEETVRSVTTTRARVVHEGEEVQSGEARVRHLTEEDKIAALGETEMAPEVAVEAEATPAGPTYEIISRTEEEMEYGLRTTIKFKNAKGQVIVVTTRINKEAAARQIGPAKYADGIFMDVDFRTEEGIGETAEEGALTGSHDAITVLNTIMEVAINEVPIQNPDYVSIRSTDARRMRVYTAWLARRFKSVGGLKSTPQGMGGENLLIDVGDLKAALELEAAKAPEVEVEAPPAITDPTPLPVADKLTIYEAIEQSIKNLKAMGPLNSRNRNLVRRLRNTVRRLRDLEARYGDRIPVLKTLQELHERVQALEIRSEALLQRIKDSKLNQAAEKGREALSVAEAIRERLAKMSDDNTKRKMTKEEKAEVTRIEKEFGKKPPKIWRAEKKSDWQRINRLFRLISKETDAAIMAYETSKEGKKNLQEGAELIGERRKIRIAAKKEDFKLTVAAVREEVGDFITVERWQNLRTWSTEMRQTIAADRAFWDAHWDADSDVDADTLLFLFSRQKFYVAELQKEHGKGPWTREQAEPYFEKVMQRKELEITRMNTRSMLLRTEEFNKIAQEILESDAVTIADWDPNRRFQIAMTPEQRAERINNGEDTEPKDYPKNLFALSEALMDYARSLSFVFDRTMFGKSDDGAVLYEVLKKALPRNLRGTKIEILFKEALTATSKLKDPVRSITDLRFDISDVRRILIMKLSQTSDVISHRFRKTAENILADLKDPNNTNSQWSLYTALEIATRLQEASVVLDLEAFQTAEETQDGGFIIDVDRDSRSVTYGNSVEFHRQVAVAMAFRLKQYNYRGHARGKIIEALYGRKDARPDVTDIVAKVETYLSDLTVEELGNGTKGYGSAATVGAGLIDFVAGKVPGIRYRLVNIHKESLKGLADLEEVEVVAISEDEESLRLLVPGTNDITKWGPLHDWKLAEVIQDEVFRNRVGFVTRVPMTDSIRKQHMENREESLKAGHMFYNVDRRAAARFAPFVNNRSLMAKVQNRAELRDAVYEIMVDMPPALAAFIHDAILFGGDAGGFFAQVGKGREQYTQELTTGFATAVPLGNMGWISSMNRLLNSDPRYAHRAEDITRMLVEAVVRKGIDIEQSFENFQDAVDSYNYADQQLQGINLFILHNRPFETAKGSEEVGLIDILQSISDASSLSWKTDLKDRYITSGIAIAETITGSEKHKIGELEKFRRLYNKLGITPATTEAEYKQAIDPNREGYNQQWDKIRDVLFKPGPLRTVYMGGKNAWINHWRSQEGIAGRETLSDILGEEVTIDDMIALGDHLYGKFIYEGQRLMNHSMDLPSHIVESVIKKFTLGKKSKVSSLKKTDVTKIREQQEALQKELDERYEGEEHPEGGETVPMPLIKAADAAANLAAQIEDIARDSGRTEKEVRKFYMKRIYDFKEELERIKREEKRDWINNIEYHRLNQILYGDTLGWRDVQHLRSMNLMNSVAYRMNVPHMKLQARMMGMDFNQSDLLGLENSVLFHTFMPSHDSQRYYPTVYDVMNIHPHNMDASKISTRNWSEDILAEYNVKVKEYQRDGYEHDDTGEMSDAEMMAMAWMFENNKAPFGMWDIHLNQFHSAKERFGSLDENRDFVKKTDEKKWRAWIDQELDDLLIRDEMLYFSTFEPPRVKEYGQDFELEDGTVISNFSEETGVDVFDAVVQRWKVRSKESDREYLKMQEQVDTYSRKLDSTDLDEASKVKKLLQKISGWHGIPVDQLERLPELGTREGISRWVEEWDQDPTVGEDTTNPANVIGMRTSHTAGYSAMRPLIARVPWESVGLLELRKRYYENQIEELERHIPLTGIEGTTTATSIDDVIPAEARGDVNILSTRDKVVFPQLNIDVHSGLLNPSTSTAQVLAQQLRQNVLAWATQQGYDMEALEQDRSGYALLQVIMDLDNLYGYTNSDTTDKGENISYSFIDEMSRLESKASGEGQLANAIFHLRHQLATSINLMHRIPTAVVERRTPAHALHGEAADVGTPWRLTDGQIAGMTYNQLLSSEVMGKNLLAKALAIGYVGDELMVIKDNKLNDNERILFTKTREGTLFNQSHDAGLLVMALADLIGIEEYIRDFHPEWLSDWKSGQYSKWEPEVLINLLVKAFQHNRDKDIGNYALMLTIGENADSKPEVVGVDKVHVPDAEKGEIKGTVKRSVLSTGFPFVSRTVVGTNIKVLLTLQGAFHALSQLQNHKIIEAAEMAARRGIPVNMITTVDGKPALRQAVASRLQQDLGFSFREDRARASMGYSALRIIAGKNHENLKTVKEAREIGGEEVRFIDTKKYINSDVNVALYPGSSVIHTDAWGAAILTPVRKVLNRLNGGGAHEVNANIEAMIKSLKDGNQENMNALLILGFMLRNNNITIAQLKVVLPNMGNMEASFVIATNRLREINKALQWRSYSATEAHLHQGNSPEGGWKSRANPFYFFSRGFWENVHRYGLTGEELSSLVDDPEGRQDLYEEFYLPRVEAFWKSLRRRYTVDTDPTGKPLNTDLIEFYDDHWEALAMQAFMDELSIVTEHEDDMSAFDLGVPLMEHARVRSKFTIDPQRLKKYRKESNIVDAFQKQDFYPAVSRLLNNIKRLENDGTINEMTADIWRVTIGYFAERNPEFLRHINLSSESLQGPKIAFAQKVVGIGEGEYHANDLYQATAGESVESASLKNILLLNGYTKERIDSLEELTDHDNWMLDTKRVISVDIETRLDEGKDGSRVPIAIAVRDRSLIFDDPNRTVYTVGKSLKKGLTPKQVQQVLDRLEELQNQGYKIVTHNGNGFDLKHLGVHADRTTQAGLIALRSFDIMQILSTTDTGRADITKPWFRLDSVAQGLGIASEKRVVIGDVAIDLQASAYVLYKRSLGRDVEAIDYMGIAESEVSLEERVEWAEVIQDMSEEEAGDMLRRYTSSDVDLTDSVFLRLQTMAVGSEINLDSVHGEMAIDMPAMMPSWRVLPDKGANLPGSMYDWNSYLKTAANYTFKSEEDARPPGYHIVMDPDMIGSMGTLGATEVLFHELSHIGVYKFMHLDSADWVNTKNLVQSNPQLIRKLAQVMERGQNNPNVDARYRYYMSNPSEAVAALASYRLMMDILGDGKKDSLASEMEREYVTNSLWDKVRVISGKVFRWMADIMMDINKVFVTFADENPHEFDNLMAMTDQIFGLAEGGGRLDDVGNQDIAPEFMEEFSAYAPPEVAADVDDSVFHSWLVERDLLRSIVSREGFEVTPIDEQNRTRNKLKDLGAKILKHGYKSNDPLSPAMDTEGRDVYGLTREEYVKYTRLQDEMMKSSIDTHDDISIDGLQILNSTDPLMKRAFASRVFRELSGYLGGQLSEGLGGALSRTTETILGGKAKGIVKAYMNAITGWSGAAHTFRSPFVTPVVLANMLVEGATLTESSVITQEEGIVSSSVARTNAQAAEASTWGDTNAAYRAFRDSANYPAAARKLPMMPGYDKEQRVALERQFRMDLTFLILDPKQDLSRYDDATQKAMQQVATTYNRFIRDDFFWRSRRNGRFFMDKKVETVPWLMRRQDAGGDLDITSSFLSAIQTNMRSRIEKNSSGPDGMMHPVVAYVSGILPSLGDTKESIKEIQNKYPEWHDTLAKEALEEYFQFTGKSPSSMTLTTFKEGLNNIEIIRAWQRVTLKILKTYNSSKASREWSTVPSEDMGLMKSTYNAAHAAPTSDEPNFQYEARIKELANVKYDSEVDIAKPWLARDLTINESWKGDVMKFLSQSFVESIGWRPYFVQNSTWVPLVSEMLRDKNPDVALAVESSIETDPKMLMRTISRTVGHTAIEVDMFAKITKTNLNFDELLDLFEFATDFDQSGAKITDGQGKTLSRTDQNRLTESMKVLRRKYSVLRGVASKLNTAEDVTLSDLARDASWVIKVVYGSNLAVATSMVEGSMAALVGAVGYGNIASVLTPFMAYLRPFVKKGKHREAARDMMYSMQLAMGRIDPGTWTGWDYEVVGVERGGGLEVEKPEVRQDPAWLRGQLQKWGRGAVNHAMEVNQELRTQIDLQLRLFYMDRLHDGSWAKLAKEVEGLDMKVLLSESKNSRVMWKDLTRAAKWKGPWRAALFLAQHGLLTKKAVTMFRDMDSGSRDLFGHNEKFFQPYLMRQWVMSTIDTDPGVKNKKGRAKYDDHMKVWRSMRSALGSHIDTIMVNPSVLDLNVVPDGLHMLITQYRTFPMLFTNQRIIRDSSRYDPSVYLIRVLTNTLLDMAYTTLTMIAGGFRVDDLQDAWEEDPALMGTLLASRLPFFGFWGGLVFEAANAVAYGKELPFSPISLSGLVKIITGALGATGGAFQAAIPGGQGWDKDSDTKDLINSIRTIPYLGESLLRGILHNTIRTGNSRGTLGRYGSGKYYGNFGAQGDHYQMDPRVVAEELMRELAPNLFPDDIKNLPYEEYVALRQNIRGLADVEPEEAIEKALEAVPEPVAESEKSPISRNFLSAPEIPRQGFIPYEG